MSKLNLSAKYKAIAMHLDEMLRAGGVTESGIDLQMYKSNQMCAEAGVQKKNGRYKIPVTLAEVKKLAGLGIDAAEAAYIEACSVSRGDGSWRQPEPCEALGNLAREIMKAAVAEHELKQQQLATRRGVGRGEKAGKKWVGLKQLENALAAALYVGREGEPAFSGSYQDWSTVALVFHLIGEEFGLKKEAEEAFLKYSKASPGFVSEKDVLQRFHSIDETTATAHVTIATLIFRAKAVGPFLEPNPCGKADYNFPENALEVLNEWLESSDKAWQRRRLREDVFIGSYRACWIAGYNVLKGDVLDRAKALGLQRELKRAVEALDVDLGTLEQEETTQEKVSKWTASKVEYALDQVEQPVITIGADCYSLNEPGSVKGALAKLWVSDPATAEKPFPERSVIDLIPTMIAKARISNRRVIFDERFIRANKVTYIDFHWCVVEVAKCGWKIIDRLPEGLYFKRTLWSMPMPSMAIRSGAGCVGEDLLNRLLAFTRILNLPEKSVPILAACLTYPIRHETGFPVLALTGPAGAGKTVMAGKARRFLDPSSRAAEALPRSDSDTAAVIMQSIMTVFDNISGMTLPQSDMIAALATNPRSNQISKRKLFTDGDLSSISCGRIIWTTGIVRTDDQADLRSRTVGLRLLPLTGEVETEQELEARFDQYAPDLMAALLDLTVRAWGEVETYIQGHPIRSKISRMSSFDMWLGACYQVLGLGWQTGITTLSEEREQEAIQAIENHKWLGGLTSLEGEFIGTAKQLNNELLKIAGYSQNCKPGNWIGNKALLYELCKQQTALLKAGFVFEELPPTANGKAKRFRIVAPYRAFD